MTAKACGLLCASPLLSDFGFARLRWSSSFLLYFSSTLLSARFRIVRSIHVITRNEGSRFYTTLASSIPEVADELIGNAEKVSELMRMERKPYLSREADESSGMLSSLFVEGAVRKRWFPYLDAFRSGDTTLSSAEILEAIEPCLLCSRKERFRNVVNNRTYSVCLVVEGLTDFGNVSAAFRSADALGFQSVHVISKDNSKRYRENRNVSKGSEKWLDLELWNSTQDCFKVLKTRGYRIATACVGTNTVSIHDIDWTIPTAIVVGNEHSGITEEAGELADLHCSIPMMGMVDSFNVSVAAGIIMHHAVCHRSSRLGFHGDLTPEESQILLAEFCLRHGKDSISIVHEFARQKLVQRMGKLYPIDRCTLPDEENSIMNINQRMGKGPI